MNYQKTERKINFYNVKVETIYYLIFADVRERNTKQH